MIDSYLDADIDPEFRSILTQPPAYLGAWSSERYIRRIGRDIIFPAPIVAPDENVDVSGMRIPGPDGGPDIRLRIYSPKSRSGKLPGLMLFHYGGYTIGSPEHEDALCYQYVSDVGCVIVAPAYRLAPENPAPAAYEDCYAAWLWLSENADLLDIDKNRIAVTGLSSGGGLTLAVCLMARDRGGPMPCFMMPVAPTIDDKLATPSSRQFNDPRALNYDSCRKIWNMYLGKGHEDRDDISPYAAPARERDLRGLPPCYCYVGGLDPHRDETINLVSALARAGVQTSFSLYAGGIHAFQLEIPEAKLSRQAISAAEWALRRALYPDR